MRIINMDNMAASPVLPEVAEVMVQYLTEKYGNASSMHSLGEEVGQDIEEAHGHVATLINANPGEVVFTSCGTESNNFALKGVANANKAKGTHVIASSIEHFSIMHALKSLERQGFYVTRLPVDRYRSHRPRRRGKIHNPQTILISVMPGTISNRYHPARSRGRKD